MFVLCVCCTVKTKAEDRTIKTKGQVRMKYKERTKKLR
jgi:uncharacterized protein YeaC (DUF1315 family)